MKEALHRRRTFKSLAVFNSKQKNGLQSMLKAMLTVEQSVFGNYTRY